MDPNPPRHPRGRARGQSQVPPPNQGQSRGPLRHQAQLQAPPPNQGQSRPRGPPLNQGLPQIPSSYREQALTFHTTQAPPSRPQPNIPDQLNPQQQFRPQNVEQVTSGLENLKTGGAEKIQGQKMKLLESLGEKCTKMYNFFKLKNDTHNSSNKKLTESTVLLKKIQSNLQNSYVSIIADKTSDIGHEEQLSIVVCYFDSATNWRVESFITLKRMIYVTANSIFQTIDDILTIELGLQWTSVLSVCFDGASTMKHELNLSGILQPMLVSKKKKSFKIPGDESKWVYLIPELCTMTGLTTKMRDNHYLMADLAMYTRIGPTERIGRYNNFMDQILTTPESADLLTQWNLTLSNKLVTIPGRVLPQEMLQVNEQKFSTGNDANWTAQLCSSSMFTCAEIKRWAVLCPEGNSNQLRQFIQTLLKVAKNMSFNLPLPEMLVLS
ncbi:PREDICTED: piwi-like protein 2 [Diuraphis noxia]|uniref:piwi-like protein 2 n=1 Tax=Diuraphis noxia TaxID=143948 RepID=UPI0007637F03|nr:PREDICTED: piwi-like protein 2 [Diuraphis noxia]